MSNWLFVRAFPQADGLAAARAVVGQKIVGQLAEAHGVESAVWVATVRAQLDQLRGLLTVEVRRRAAEWAYRWHLGLLERTEQMAEAAVATVGLPYAIAFEWLSRHLRELLAPTAQELGAYAGTDIAAFPERLGEAGAALPRGRLEHGAQLADQIRDQYEEQVYHHINAHAALLTGQVLLDMATRVLAPLAAALREAQRRLDTELDLQVSDAGLARLATHHVTLWPRHNEGVPERFAHADNEILLTDTATFPEQYDADIRGADFLRIAAVSVSRISLSAWANRSGTPSLWRGHSVTWWVASRASPASRPAGPARSRGGAGLRAAPRREGGEGRPPCRASAWPVSGAA